MVDAEMDDLPPIDDPSAAPRIHTVGVAGAGMSAIATVLAQMGYVVSGTDRAAGAVIDRLVADGIDARVGHDPAAVAGAALVTASTAVADDNVEVVAARRAGIPVWTRARTLSAITRRAPTVAVGGTHGKTTTSAMLTHALFGAGLDPSFLVGAEVIGLGAAARWVGPDAWFVVEADESDGTFVELARSAAVVTSLEADHLSHHGSHEALVGAFGRFVADTDGPVVLCADDPAAAALASSTDGRVVTYGFAPDAEVRIVDHHGGRAASTQTLQWRGHRHDVELSVPGRHNATNAAGAFAAAVALGAEPAAAVAGLAAYQGTPRRFQPRGSVAGVDFVDDYAHLPTEIAAALAAAADGGWGRIVVAFQPHRYTRTRDLHTTFGPAFHGADHVVVTGIYSSGEEPIAGVSGALVADAVRRDCPEVATTYCDSLDEAAAHLADELTAGDLCLTLGAGDVTTLADEVQRRLAGQAP